MKDFAVTGKPEPREPPRPHTQQEGLCLGGFACADLAVFSLCDLRQVSCLSGFEFPHVYEIRRC